jgi:acyl-CoA dehydrogenase
MHQAPRARRWDMKMVFDESVNTPYCYPAGDQFRRDVRAALSEVVRPRAENWEVTGNIPHAAWLELASRGLLALSHEGADFIRSAIFLEELGRTGYCGVRAAVGVHSYMALSYLVRFGSPKQKEQFLVPARQGKKIAALAITENGAGSDLRQIQTRADRRPDGSYRVNGEKVYVTNGTIADFIVTLVRTRDVPSAKVLSGVTFLIVPAELPGVARARQPMVGWHSAGISRVTFDDVTVPGWAVLGEPDRALGQLVSALDFERMVAGLMAVGGIGYSLEQLDAALTRNRISDKPLQANSFIRQSVADLLAEYELTRLYAYHTAWLQSVGKLDCRTASVLKLKATELAVKVAEKCIQYSGACGYLADADAGRQYRDSVAGTLAGGSSELLRDIIFSLS